MKENTLSLYHAWLEAVRVREEFANARPYPEWSSNEFFQYAELESNVSRALRAWWNARGAEDWAN